MVKKKKGRDFELLISNIEKILSPEGAIIKSPDYIEDKYTGIKREVDIDGFLSIQNDLLMLSLSPFFYRELTRI